MADTNVSGARSAKRNGRLRDPIWQFLSFVAAIIAIGISVYSSYDIYLKTKSSKRLAVEIVYSAPIISPGEASVSEFEFMYEGKHIDCASVVGMDIENVGNVPIRPGDFVTPISITVPPPARVVVRRIENADPQSLQPRLNQVRASEIALEPLLLNPGDSFRVELTMLDVHEPVDSSLAVTGRIVGMKDIEFSVRPANGEVQHGLARAYNTEAMIIIPIGTLVVFLALWFWPKLWDWIEHVFGKRPGSTWGRISLNLAVATLVAIALEDIVEGVVEIVRAIIMR